MSGFVLGCGCFGAFFGGGRFGHIKWAYPPGEETSIFTF